MKIKFFEYLKEKILSAFNSEKSKPKPKPKPKNADKDKSDDIYPLW